MTDRHLQARALLGEAQALGIGLSDLMAASTEPEASVPTVAAYIEVIAMTFTPGTSRTYQPYWRLAAANLGDRRLDHIAVADLQAVVDAARRPRPARPAHPARQHRTRLSGDLHRRAASAVRQGSS